MKLRNIIITALGCMLFASCGDKFFEQYPSNNVTEGNFYQTDDDFNQGVASCYRKLKTNLGDIYNKALAYRGDECYMISSTVSEQFTYDIDHFQDTPSNGLLSDLWDNWYNGIYRCNDVLDHMEGKDIANYDRYRGECLFIRSWYYFNLYRMFGGVPITRTVATPGEAKLIRRCTAEEMYELLTADLAEAAEKLPVSRDAEKARVTQIAANTLLAKVCLTFGHPEDAEEPLKAALADPGYGLEESTARAMDASNKLNKEIIFAVAYNKSIDAGHGVWFGEKTNVMEDIVNPTPEFKAIYDSEKDNRWTLIGEYFQIQSNPASYVLNKWKDTYDATYTTQVGNDYVHLRYADLVLLNAEMLAQTNRLSEAIAQLNRTRTRAGLDELTSADVPDLKTFIKELADERGRELALEGHRWFDLVRLGLAVDFFRAAGFMLDEHNLLFPIPNSQIEIVNNSSILWQNPGY